MNPGYKHWTLEELQERVDDLLASSRYAQFDHDTSNEVDRLNREIKARRNTPHSHEYRQHPHWTTHAYCAICGFAAPKSSLSNVAL